MGFFSDNMDAMTASANRTSFSLKAPASKAFFRSGRLNALENGSDTRLCSVAFSMLFAKSFNKSFRAPAICSP